MKKKELLRVFAGFMIAGGVLAGCSANDTEKAEDTNQEQTDTKSEPTEVFNVEESDAAKQVQVFADMKTELEKAKENQKVDWDIVLNTYQAGMQGAINEVDGAFDQTIQAAIQAGKSGEIDANIARQLVDKTTQSYFYQLQKRLHKDSVAALEAGNQNEATAAFEQIKYLAKEIFIPTAIKRDSYYNLTGEASIEQSINAGLTAQEEALKANNVEDFSVFVQLTDKSVYRIFYLASNGYAEKIESAVKEGKEELELKVMQAEGWGFLQAIKGSLSGGDEEAANKLDEIFSLDKTNPTEIKADEVSNLFVKAIVGKIVGYHGKTPVALDENKIVEARTEALEANMFLKAFEIELTKQIGEEKAKELYTQAENWYNAIAENNKEEASKLSEEILTVTNQLVK